jgi:hypothetical protein
MSNYAQLGVSALAKLINDEYAAILQSEKANLPRAIAIGAKLKAIRIRVGHGEWQEEFKSHGLNISYETATLYIRLFDNWDEIQKRARAKDVEPTDLTIDEARKLLSKPRPKDDKPKANGKAAIAEPAISVPKSVALDKAMKPLATDEIFDNLKLHYAKDRDGLRSLTEMLAKHLGLRLMEAPTARPSPVERRPLTPT